MTFNQQFPHAAKLGVIFCDLAFSWHATGVAQAHESLWNARVEYWARQKSPPP